MLRMRLRRTGAKKQPRYRVVIAEARGPRDGAFVDIIGFYDPLTEPATVRIDRDKALGWLGKGAQPSDTVQRLLRNSGIIGESAPVVSAPVDDSAAAVSLSADDSAAVVSVPTDGASGTDAE